MESPHIIIDIAQSARLVRYAIMVAFTFQTFDYVVMFKDEVEYVWLHKAPLYRQMPYILNRYLPFFTVGLSIYFMFFGRLDTCKFSHFLIAGLALAGAIIAECTLFLRAYAVYKGKGPIAAILLTFALSSIAGTSYVTVTYINASSTLVSSLTSNSTGCLYMYRLRTQWISLVLLISCETLVTLLLLIRARGFLSPQFTLMHHMCKDAILCFVTVIAISVVNLVAQFFASDLLCDALLIPQSVLQQILCTHLLLRIREAHELSLKVSSQPSLTRLESA